MDPRRGRAWLTGLVLGLVAVACGPSDLLGPEAEQGVEGIALRGPMCPVVSLDEPCPDQPYQAWVTLRTEVGREVTRFRTGEDGRFRVGLRPGRYRLIPDPGDPFPVADAVDVEVVAGAYTEVTLSFDTGIR